MGKLNLHEAVGAASKAKDVVVEKIQNINTLDIIAKAAQLPGAKIDRTAYLAKELRKYYPENVISEAIKTSPYEAGVTKQAIDNIAKASIKYETSKVTVVSAVAGIPGGIALFGTIPIDTAQYFVFMLRIAQKLAYLYGYPEIEFSENTIDDAAMNELTFFLGGMVGIKEANIALKRLSEMVAKKLPKKLMRQALTKGTVFPIVKNIAKKLGLTMTKEIFANGVGKVIPFVGGVVSGGLTFATFKPCCYRLKKELEKNFISDSGNGDFTHSTSH